MGNVIVKSEIKYRVARKEGNKEVSQKFYKYELNTGEMDEDDFLLFQWLIAIFHWEPDFLIG